MTRIAGSVRYCLLLALFSCWDTLSQKVDVVISEVALKRSGGQNCNGEDWIELLNTGENVVYLTDYILHDDKGKDNENAKIFSEGVIMTPGEFLVLCKGEDFEFGISNDDTVTLLDDSGFIVVDSVTLPGNGTNDETYSYIDGEYKYTATPTPGEANIYKEPIPLEAKFKAQNDAGNDFFLVNDAETFGKVVDIYVSVDEGSMSIIEDHPAWEEWVPFSKLSVSNIGDSTDDEDSDSFTVSSGGGRIRVRDQTTNVITVCLGFKTVPFGVEFDTPFLGMETMYLRNHLSDPSYMRDHASHAMLEAFGLPYLRTRPARLFLNGKYVGFYTLMEAPTQGYVMQRSFGAFDPEKAALFKLESRIAKCPFDVGNPAVAAAANNPPIDKYYFERGDHRDDTPILGVEGKELEAFELCSAFSSSQLYKEEEDVIRGYLEHDKKCGLTMVELGRVDREYGPKSMEDPMIAFLDGQFYNERVDDLNGSIDTDQWLKNFAVYAVMINIDSPLVHISNWYLASTERGVDDWKIVQYDHNNVLEKGLPRDTCGQACGPRMVYWPILQPTCGPVEDHMIVGRVLNSEENMRKYLKYVQEFVDTTTGVLGNIQSYDNDIQEYVDALASGGVLEKMYAYGNGIKKYVMDDPLNSYSTVEDYEKSELGKNFEDYNSETAPFLKTFQARLEQVQKQLDAIQEGTLPRGGVYNPNAVCPDWRDSASEVFKTGSEVADSCIIPACIDAAACYDNGPTTCSPEGDLLVEECKAITPICDNCYPYSRCGTGAEVTEDYSATFVESETCGSLLADCTNASPCFDHKSGICAFDGEILTVECQMADSICSPCFPYSRCGFGEAPEIVQGSVGAGDGSGLFVKGGDCIIDRCAEGAHCFDHGLENCLKDGSISKEDSQCQQALQFCVACYPYSRCGGGEVMDVAEEVATVETEGGDRSGFFIKGEDCTIDQCADGAPCFDHAFGSCLEDGSMSPENMECQQALQFCSPCYPYSRCGGGEVFVVEEVDDEETAVVEATSGAHRTRTTNVASWILVLVMADLSWCWMTVQLGF